jgi:hypothetical protein
VTGLSGRARWQVRKLLAVLTRMRKSLPPSARVEAVRRLGWRLGPGIEACRAITEGAGPKPAQAPEGGDQIRKFLEEWQQKYRESEERYRTERDEAFRSDDEVARAEEQLATERAAELKKRTKTTTETAAIGLRTRRLATRSASPMLSGSMTISTCCFISGERRISPLTSGMVARQQEDHCLWDPWARRLSDRVTRTP